MNIRPAFSAFLNPPLNWMISAGGNSDLSVLLYQFYRLLASQMFYLHTQHQHSMEALVYFHLQCFIMVGVVAVSQQSGCRQSLCLILYDVDAPERDYAAEIGGISLAMHLVLVNHTEGSLVTVADGIHFMTAQSTMEIEFPVMIDKTDGHGVWVAAITEKGERARCGITKYGDTLRLCQLLPFTAHFSELHVTKWF